MSEMKIYFQKINQLINTWAKYTEDIYDILLISYFLIRLKDLDQWADTTAPKALADVFEALIGAIFLDSGHSLEVVWRVLEPLLRHYLGKNTINEYQLSFVA